MKNGKILKVRLGHEANCSSGMIFVAMLFLSVITYLPTAVITATIHANQAKKSGSISQKARSIPQIIGLVITIGMLIFGVTSGYNAESLGIIAIVLGAGFAITVYISNKVAPKIGYWNILAVPLILVVLVFILFALLASFSYY